MLQRPAVHKVWHKFWPKGWSKERRKAHPKAANDNFVRHRPILHRVRMFHDVTMRSAQDLMRMPFIPRRQGEPIPSPEPLRIGVRPLLVAAFSGLILVALSGAFLLGLAVVGLMAGVVAGFELVRRHLCRSGRLVALNRPV